jgi:hypothetical protein
MKNFSWKLHQLRGFFIIYLVARFGIEIFPGWDIVRDLLEEGRFHGINRLVFPPGVLFFLIGFVMLVMVLLGLWIFHNLLQKKNWARIVLLIMGWLAVADSVFSLIFTAQSSGLFYWLMDLAPDMDWSRILLVERLKDILGLIFWGYLIVVLQFDRRTKQVFLGPESEAR